MGYDIGDGLEQALRPQLRGVTPTILAEAASRGHLARSPLLQGLKVTDFEALLANARWKRLDRGTTLTLRGSRPAHAWFLLTGFVKEHRPLADGDDAVCAFRGPGDLVGEVGALTGSAAGNDSTLLTQGEGLAISARALAQVAGHSERLQQAVFRAVTARAAEAEDALARNETTDITERVAAAVLALAERWGVTLPTGLRVGLPLTQAELASWVGVSRETAAKVLSAMRSMEILSTSRRRLVIHDVEQLRQIASGQGAPWATVEVA